LILTLTINPAIDRVINVDKLVFEDRAYILDQAETAGGRGINASQVVHAFGGKTRALLTSGGPAGKRMLKSLSGMGFPFDAVQVEAEIQMRFKPSATSSRSTSVRPVG
jgi:fructose-1-phosphate kinase PfkB-like protein